MMQETTSQSNDISLRDLLKLLRRRKVIVIQTFVAILVMGIVITAMTKPVYRTSTRILVEGKTMGFASYNSGDPLNQLFMPTAGYSVETQIEVLQSENFLNDAYKKASIPATGPGVGLDVRQVGDTEVIEVFTQSQNAKLAEQLANAIPGEYLNYVMKNRTGEVSKALEYTRSELDKASKDLINAEAALMRFKRGSGVVDMQAERSQQITQAGVAEVELQRAEAAAAGDQAKLDTMVAARNALPAFIETPKTSTNNVAINAQKDKIAEKQAERAKLLILFKPNSPEVEKLDAQIREMDSRLAQIPDTITTTERAPNPAIPQYDQQVAQARAAVTQSQAQLDKLRARTQQKLASLGKYNSIEMQEAQLKRDVDQLRGSVTYLSENLRELQMRTKALHQPVVNITPAGPAYQVAPKPARNILLAMMLGLFLGIAFAVLQEFLDDRINAPEEARQLMGIPALGYIPMVEKQEARLLTDARGGSTLESYRVLRSNVQFATVGKPVCSLMVTSTNPGEGKSVTATNLAISMALDGRRVILVDADLRLPTIHQKLGVSLQPGLTSVLVGRAALEDALQETETPGLRVLTAGPIPPNPAEMLNSEAMRQLHDELKEHADVVIFDCPPCLATADAQVMSALVDGCLYVLHLGETRKSAVRHSMELLQQAHARVLGIVFNKIDLQQNRDNYYYTFESYYNNYTNDGKNGQLPRRASETSEALPGKNGSHKLASDRAVVAAKTEETEDKA